jgi:hypothetical protein
MPKLPVRGTLAEQGEGSFGSTENQNEGAWVEGELADYPQNYWEEGIAGLGLRSAGRFPSASSCCLQRLLAHPKPCS